MRATGFEPVTVPLYEVDLFRRHARIVDHAIFTRHGGVSSESLASLNVSYSVGDVPANVVENRTRCLAALHLALPNLTVAGLVHGADVGCLEAARIETTPDGSGMVRGVDALITATPGRALMITAADCLQIMLLDPVTPAIGLAHAGWRGLVAGTIGATIAAMRERYGSRPREMVAGIGPGLGPCCAEFTDPERELPPAFAPYIHGRHVDLWSAALDQLSAGGLPRASIEQMAICTRCHRDTYFSHRGDHGRTGRFAAVLCLRSGTECPPAPRGEGAARALAPTFRLPDPDRSRDMAWSQSD